ncbi:MAG: sensor histidine kinase, partial [Gemmatimonadaceae bacterium]
MQAVMELVAPQAGERGITLDVATPPGTLVVRADPERFRQILLNLVVNAVKFTPRGGVVNVRARLTGPDVIVEVEDTGEGISPRDRESIFAPFVRLRPGHAPGVGLGLAISRDMARAMGGDLSVDGNDGNDGNDGIGSCFTLRLPSGGVASSSRSAH